MLGSQGGQKHLNLTKASISKGEKVVVAAMPKVYADGRGSGA